ncbi:MAG TPA: lipopolysaccharide kinase InaA family protein [Candidatus Binatia bacterium]
MLTETMVWGVIPDGFKKITDGRGIRLVVRGDRAGEIDTSICREDRGGGHEYRYQGRRPLRAIRLRDGETALIRGYRHGGFFRAVTRACFITWPPRPFRELAITEELRRRGLPTVEVYAAGVERVCGPFYRGCLVTRELPGAKDLWAALQDESVAAHRLTSVLKATAETLRAMHREGVYHSDLNLKNILVRFKPDGAEGYVIDFDRAKLVLGKLPPPLARKNLDRLLRSALKLDPQRRYLSAESWNEFLNFYHGAADI